MFAPRITHRLASSSLRAQARRTPTALIPTRYVRTQFELTPRGYAMTSAGMLDVTREIKIDHDNVRDLFERFQKATTTDEKGVIGNTLIREMAIHGDAEEISIYNEYGVFGLDAEHNKSEHAEIKKLVYAADDTGADDPNFDTAIARAVNAFLEHAKEEEDHDFLKIREKLSAEDNDKTARSFLKARTMAPTRPHPMAPQTGGVLQKGAAMQGKFHDKVIETLGSRKFVDVREKHPEV